MNGHNVLACIRWCEDPDCCGATALCEHDGCSWTSDAPDEQHQISEFIVHHTNHHGNDR